MSKDPDTFARRRTQRTWVFVLLGILIVVAAIISVVLGNTMYRCLISFPFWQLATGRIP